MTKNKAQLTGYSFTPTNPEEKNIQIKILFLYQALPEIKKTCPFLKRQEKQTAFTDLQGLTCNWGDFGGSGSLYPKEIPAPSCFNALY